MASAKTLRKLFALLLSAIMVLSLAACAGNAESALSDSDNSAPSSEQSSNESSKPQETENDLPESSEASGGTASEETDGSTSSDSKILVAYFSHTGENYNVGVIEKGNTHIIADMIAEETGADFQKLDQRSKAAVPMNLDNCTSQQPQPGTKIALSVSEAAELVGVSKPTMYALIREGTIPSVHAGTKIVIHRQAVIDWLSKGESNGKETYQWRR